MHTTMAADRLIFDDSERDPDQPEPKRIRTGRSLSSVVGEALMVKSLKTFTSFLEPVLRKVVNEEMERGLRCATRSIQRPSPLQIEGPEESTLQLCFTKKLSLPVFTGSKIEDEDCNPLQILLLNVRGNQRISTSLSYPVKVEIVVLDGDFLNENCQQDSWTSEQFNEKIVRERTGKRPLITGDVNLTLRDGQASIGALMFTDNSSWIRSRTFRLGARVVPGSSNCNEFKIREAFTEPFVVKDHRGELYKKHHPPSLSDEVWRLEKIGKEGAFHKKLSSEGISTVQELLKLWIVNPSRLRSILGPGMSDKMFEMTMKHAKTCVLGNKHYVMRETNHIIVLNPICQVVGMLVNGKACGTRDLSGVQKMYVQNLVKVAYKKWNLLEEVDGQLNESALLPPGSLVEATTQCNNNMDSSRSNQNNQVHGLEPYGYGDIQLVSTNNTRFHHHEFSPYPSPCLDVPIEIDNGFSISDNSPLEGDHSIVSRAFFYGI